MSPRACGHVGQLRDILRWRCGADRLPELLGEGWLEACPRRSERLVVGEPCEPEDQAWRERLRPLNIGVAEEKVDPLARPHVSREAEPRRVHIRPKTPAPCLPRVADTERHKRGRVEGRAIAVMDHRTAHEGGRLPVFPPKHQDEEGAPRIQNYRENLDPGLLIRRQNVYMQDDRVGPQRRPTPSGYQPPRALGNSATYISTYTLILPIFISSPICPEPV